MWELFKGRAGGLESGLDLKSGLKSEFLGLGLGLGLELSGLGLGLGLGLSGLVLWLGLEVESIKSRLFLHHVIFNFIILPKATAFAIIM